ncbi:hypothetical protein GH714_041599 [Hevea brasiliensis]|uniref:Disease resistance N-terminal domain-containing protein n=1 Tax=Hevea brasiliensis TaxID=3981 RepID=A0A6A6MV11_HEVBR|nr:hypothetical protein GH714_041599 [Hevea brasiliensis]
MKQIIKDFGSSQARKLDFVLVRKFKIAKITVTGLLDHTEEKQIVVLAMKKWFNELKDVAFEADDLLDEISYEAIRSELEAGSRIKKMKALGLTMREGIRDKPSLQRTPTTSIPDDASSIYSREDDSKKIRESLLFDGNGIGVIYIVGSGGMGKTPSLSLSTMIKSRWTLRYQSMGLRLRRIQCHQDNKRYS